MDIRRTKRGTTIRLTERETAELQTSFALSIAAYGILQNFMTASQKSMSLPSIPFVARMGATMGQALAAEDQADTTVASSSPAPSEGD